MNIGLKIRTIRKEKEMKQISLAKEVGISNSYLSDIESGRTTPSLKTLIRIAAVLDVPMNDLLG